MKFVFVDDGGVLNDNRLRAQQWAQIVGQYFEERVGGDANAWRIANLSVFPGVWDELRSRQIDDFREFYAQFCAGWLSAMFEFSGTEAGSIDPIEFYKPLSLVAGLKVNAEIEGAAQAIRELAEAAQLHMASGTASWELEHILKRMDIRSCFHTLYGPDITNYNKIGPAFFTKIFEHRQIEAQDCIVVESSDTVCAWAREAGATVVHVDITGNAEFRLLSEAKDHILSLI